MRSGLALRMETSGPWRHLKRQVMRIALYYSQTRSRQEAGLFRFRE